MFSLADQIEKFEAITLTLPDQIITMDERFLGGGVRLQDLIQENSFIITEMRKFKSIFLSFCQLNNKVYKKLIEYEVNANDHLNKVYAISSSIDRRMFDSDQQMKNTKQDILKQINSLTQFTQNQNKSLKNDIEKRVSEDNFGKRVKKIIQQYENYNGQDGMQSNIQVRSDGQGVNENGVPASSGPGLKRRRGITMEDIEIIKSQIAPLIDQTNSRIVIQDNKINEHKAILETTGQKIHKLQLQTQWFTQDMLSVKKQIDELKAFVKNQDKKIVDLLKETINENVWTSRFQYFNEKSVHPALEKLSDKFYRAVQDIRKEIQEGVKPKFIDLSTQIIKLREREKIVDLKFKKNDQKFVNSEVYTNEVKSQLISKIAELRNKHQKLINQQLSERRSDTEKLQKELKSIKKIINQLTATTQDAVLKKVQHRMGKQMKQIRSDICELNKRASDINKSVMINEENVGHVKDVVATKANFTDLVMYFDSKADKKDFKQLHDKLTESPKGSVGCQQEKFKFENTMKHSDQKKRIKSSYSKRLTTPGCTKNEQDSNRYLLIGWESSEAREVIKTTMKNSHNNLTSKSRNKSIRPSTANTLFLL